MSAKLMFLKAGAYFVPTDVSIMEKYRFLSNKYEGDIYAVVRQQTAEPLIINKFRIMGLYLPRAIRYSSFFRNIAYTIFVITKSFYIHHFKSKYDAIISYDPLVTGILALIVGQITGAKVIIEVNGNYEKAFLFQSSKLSAIDHLKHKAVFIIIPFVLKHADGVKLVHKNQLDIFKSSGKTDNTFIFPNFVPISHFKPQDTSEVETRYILFMGFPWHLKGVDILIKAFNKISQEFPGYQLKIVGHCEDQKPYIDLCNGNSRIVLCNPVPYAEAIMLMSGCTLFILPSRTDSSPRVLREAMAAKKPIIASNIDGIPDLIRNGENGILFESENVEDLADKIRIILSDSGYASKLADCGYKFVYSTLSEECYLNQFDKMIKAILTPKKSRLSR